MKDKLTEANLKKIISEEMNNAIDEAATDAVKRIINGVKKIALFWRASKKEEGYADYELDQAVSELVQNIIRSFAEINKKVTKGQFPGVEKSRSSERGEVPLGALEEKGGLKRSLKAAALGTAIAAGGLAGGAAGTKSKASSAELVPGPKKTVPGQDVRPIDQIQYVKKGYWDKKAKEDNKGTKEIKTCSEDGESCTIQRVKVNNVDERSLTSGEKEKKEKYVKSLKDKVGDFKARYGDRWEEVLYATATKMAKQNEELLRNRNTNVKK